MSEFRLSLCVPCYLKPQRTLRAIESVLNQDTNGWEAIFMGDGCPNFADFQDDGTFSEFSERALENGNEMHFINLKEHKGGWGYAARNVSFKLARGQYVIFLDNDDVLKPNHFSNYLSAIEGTDADMVYFNSYIEPIDAIRESELRFGCIGHSEIIVKADLLKTFTQKPEYGHDWHLIEHLIRKNAVIKKSNNPPTYIIKEIGGGHPNRERLTEKNID
mgnify:FL=1